MGKIALRKSFFPESNFFSGWELEKTFDDKYITVKEELAAGIFLEGAASPEIRYVKQKRKIHAQKEYHKHKEALI